MLLTSCADLSKLKTLHGDNRPLSDEQRSIIDCNRSALAKVTGLWQKIVNRLCAKNGCLNEHHKEYIESGATAMDKVGKLLDIMRCRSVADYKKLVDALRREGQPGLARLFEKGGGKINIRGAILPVLQDYSDLFCVTI